MSLNEEQRQWSSAEYAKWWNGRYGTPMSTATIETWHAAVEMMLANGVDVLGAANLRSKIAELEERLRTIGGKHREDIRQLEIQNENLRKMNQIANQTQRELRKEVETWKDRLRDSLKALQDEYETKIQEMEAESKVDVDVAVLRREKELDTRFRQTLEEEKAIWEGNHKVALLAQQQVLEQGYVKDTAEMQKTIEEQQTQLRLRDARIEALEKLEKHWQSEVQRTALEDQKNFQAAILKLRDGYETEAARMQKKLSDLVWKRSAEQQGQLDSQVDLANRVNERMDQMFVVCKGLIELEIRGKLPKTTKTLPTEEDFDAWWAEIPEYREPAGEKLPNKDTLAKAAWNKALELVK